MKTYINVDDCDNISLSFNESSRVGNINGFCINNDCCFCLIEDACNALDVSVSLIEFENDPCVPCNESQMVYIDCIRKSINDIINTNHDAAYRLWNNVDELGVNLSRVCFVDNKKRQLLFTIEPQIGCITVSGFTTHRRAGQILKFIEDYIVTNMI